MNLKDIKNAVKNIEDYDGDDEKQHIHEDELYLSLIKHISDGGEVTKEMADEALKVDAMDFIRWHA